MISEPDPYLMAAKGKAVPQCGTPGPALTGAHNKEASLMANAKQTLLPDQYKLMTRLNQLQNEGRLAALVFAQGIERPIHGHLDQLIAMLDEGEALIADTHPRPASASSTLGAVVGQAKAAAAPAASSGYSSVSQQEEYARSSASIADQAAAAAADAKKEQYWLAERRRCVDVVQKNIAEHMKEVWAQLGTVFFYVKAVEDRPHVFRTVETQLQLAELAINGMLDDIIA